jgi:hypothetical protein
MSKVTFASLVGVAAAGGKLALTWEDCGDASTHGHTDTVEPSEIIIGEDTAITGTGSTDKQIESGSFTMKLTASIIKQTYTGLICEAKEFNMPLGLGTVSWGGMDCPVAVGPSTVSMGVHMSGALPASLAKADLTLTAIDQDGEQAVCVNTHLEKEATAEAGCTGTDDFPSTPVCYGSNVMGQEDVVIKIESYDSGAGQLHFEGTGATPLTCESAFEKDASNKITFDNCDVSSYATIKGAQYCSDTDELKATFNPLGVPIPVSVKLPKIDCASAVSV